MLTGAISAARMNITEYVIEGKNSIQDWKQEITSKKDTFITERSVSASSVAVGGIVCVTLGPGCIPAVIVTQLVQWVDEILTYKTSEEIDKLMRDEYNRADSYLTEKGKQAKELTNFLRTIVAMNETQQAPLVYLGEVITSYVSKNIASNATKTVADVHSDLDSMLGGNDLDADELDAGVKMLADMLFNDAPPPYVLDLFPVSTAFRILTSVGELWKAIGTLIRVIKKYRIHETNEADLLLLEAAAPERLIEDDTRVQNARKLWYDRIDLMGKLSRRDLLTLEEIKLFDLDGHSFQVQKVNGKYKLVKYTDYKRYYNQVTQGFAEDGRTTIISYSELNADLLRAKDMAKLHVDRIAELQERVRDKPTLRKVAKEDWYKSGARGMLLLALATAVIDAAFTEVQVNQINDFIDSVVSKQTSKLETTAGILKAWQELHKPI
jgi:hypothetical protein